MLRLLLIGCATFVLAGGGAFAYFVHAPAPTAPPLSATVRRDSIQVGALRRRYVYYVPARLRPGPALVLALHGSMGNAQQMRRSTGYELERLADRRGFVVAYPEGYGGHWNDCRKKGPYAAKQLRIDDVGFMRALVGQLRSAHGVDSARVFAVGLSNGGHLAYRLALEAPELVRAVAAVGASLPAEENMDCTPVPGATSVLVMNGTADPINPYEGGKVTIFGFGDRGHVVSTPHTAEYFVKRNGIASPPVVASVAGPSGGGTGVEPAVWRSPAGVEVRLYTIRNGGHVIPHPHVRSPRILGRTHRALNGPAQIWDFFAEVGPVERD